MSVYRHFSLVILLSLIIMLTGCWDQIEIQQRTFVVGLAIDTVPEDELEPPQIMERGLLYPQRNQLRITMEIPKISQFGTGGGGDSGGGGGSEKPAWVFRLNGVNLSQAITEVQLRTNRQAFLGHLQVVLVGEDYARKVGLKEIMEALPRNPEVEREVPIFIVNGEAKDALDITPPDDPLAALYIRHLMETHKFTTRTQFIVLGDLATRLFTNGNTLIGRIRPANNEVVSGGSAVIKDWKLAGFLGELETVGANMLMGKPGEVTLSVSHPEDEWYGVRVHQIKRTVRPHRSGEDFALEYAFRAEGDIIELPQTGRFITSQQKIRQLEASVEESLKASAVATLNRLQQEYETDAIGMGEHIHKHWPRVWRELKPQWQAKFPSFPTRVTVEFRLRRSGETL